MIDELLGKVAISEPLYGEKYDREEIIEVLKTRLNHIPKEVQRYLKDMRYQIVYCPPNSPSFITILAASYDALLGFTYGYEIWVYMNKRDEDWIERMIFTTMHEFVEWASLRAPVRKDSPLNEFFASLLGAKIARIPTISKKVLKVVEELKERRIRYSYDLELVFDSLAIYVTMHIPEKHIDEAINKYIRGEIKEAVGIIITMSGIELRKAISNFLYNTERELVRLLRLERYVSDEEIELEGEKDSLFINENYLEALKCAEKIYKKLMEFDRETINLFIRKAKLESEKMFVDMLKKGIIITDIMENIKRHIEMVERILEKKNKEY